MSQVLPLVPAVPFYRFGTTLAGEQFVFDVRWNERAGAWFLDVLAADTTPIRNGIKIVLGTLLGRRVVDPAFPPGVLRAVDLSGAGLDATFEDLGTRVVVYFFPWSEVA